MVFFPELYLSSHLIFFIEASKYFTSLLRLMEALRLSSLLRLMEALRLSLQGSSNFGDLTVLRPRS